MPSVEQPIITELPAEKTVVEDDAEAETTPVVDTTGTKNACSMTSRSAYMTRNTDARFSHGSPHSRNDTER